MFRSDAIPSPSPQRRFFQAPQQALPKTTFLRKQVNLAAKEQKDPMTIFSEVQKHLFFKNQSVPQVSRSYKTKSHKHFDIDELIEQHIKN